MAFENLIISQKMSLSHKCVITHGYNFEHFINTFVKALPQIRKHTFEHFNCLSILFLQSFPIFIHFCTFLPGLHKDFKD